MRFKQISDYLKQSAIHLDQKLNDFVIYDYEEVNADASVSLNAYKNDFFEISLELTESCSFKIDQFEFPVADQRLTFIHPRRLQSTIAHVMDGPCKGFTVFFSPDFMEQHLNESQFIRDYPFLQSSYSPSMLLEEKTCREITELFQLIKYEYHEYGSQSIDVIRAYLTALFEKAARKYQPVPGNGKIDRNQELTNEFEFLTDEHVEELTTVKEYAYLMNISVKHLSQVIIKTTGKRALEIICSKRINVAKSLLNQTNMSLSQIAFRLKFNSVDYFITFFKQHTGTTPNKFRLIQS